jgi:hypothetical protein
MPVRSYTLDERGHRVADTKTKKEGAALTPALRLALIAVGVLGLALFVPQWVVGAYLTLRGWYVALSLVLWYIGSSWQVPVASGDSVLLVVLGVGLAYSLVEVFLRPGKRLFQRMTRAGLSPGLIVAALLVWLLVFATDLGTTLLGIVYPGDQVWPLVAQIAASAPYAIALTAWVTIIPELVILGACRLIARGIRP